MSTAAPKWKPLAPKPPDVGSNNGIPPQQASSSREEMCLQKCLVCSKQVRTARNAKVVHCDDCNGRLSTFKNVFSSVEKVRTGETPPIITTGLGLNPNLYRKASELRLGSVGKPKDALDFGEMAWNPVSLIGRPLLSESLLDEDLTPRHVPTPETTPRSTFATTKIAASSGVIARSTNAKGSPSNPKKIIVIKDAKGVQQVLEEKSPGKYVKCSDPQKLKKCIEASRANNRVKVKVGVGPQGVRQKTKSFTLKPSSRPGQSSQKPRLIAPKPSPAAGPAFPPMPTRIMMPPVSLIPPIAVSTATPTRFVLSMPTTPGQVFQQKLPPAPAGSTSPSKTIVEACGSMSCPVCQKCFWKRNALNVHVATNHKYSRAFTCCYCNTKFSLLINLISHKLQYHPNLIKFLCRSCGLETQDRGVFNKHISPNFVATHDCSCGEQFKTAVLLQTHQKATSHSGRNDRDFQVEPESVKTATATPTFTPSTSTTTKKAEPEKPKGLIPPVDIGLVANGSIKCPTCVDNVYFAHAKYLDLHIELRHSGERVLPCQFCQLKFSHLLELVLHKVNAHPKLAKWTCKLCGVSFSNMHESEYCSHLNTHSIVTNDCRCGKQFATEDGLEEHGRLAHPGVVRFKCFQKRIQEFPSRPSTSPESSSVSSEPEYRETHEDSLENIAILQMKDSQTKLPPPAKSTPVKSLTMKKGFTQKVSKTPSSGPAVVKTYGNKQLFQSQNEGAPQEKAEAVKTKGKHSPKRAAAARPKKRSGQSAEVAGLNTSKVTATQLKDNKTKASEKSLTSGKGKAASPLKRKRGAEPTEAPAISPAKKARAQPKSPVRTGRQQKASLRTVSAMTSASTASGVRRSARERRPKRIE